VNASCEIEGIYSFCVKLILYWIDNCILGGLREVGAAQIMPGPSQFLLVVQVPLDSVPILPTQDAYPDRYVWVQQEEIDRDLFWSGSYF